MVNPESIATSKLHRCLGANPISETQTRFCVWSPGGESVSVQLADQQRTVPMNRVAGGYHVVEIEGVRAGDRYFYQLEGRTPRPDPATRYQPDGVHGPSAVASDRGFSWQDSTWRGIQRQDLVVYELHVGAFTDEGTFTAAVKRLDELVELGVNAIELMPVADSAGRWNWGYDGVCLFAPNRNFGTPDDLRRLVDAAHGKGLAVFLDVVYNHLGPEGNYLGELGPYLSTRHTTVWGAAPNFDDPEWGRQVRRFFIANAIHWFDEYHFDALRVDAIHCMLDDSPVHVAAELSEAVKAFSRESGRSAMLIAESNVYDPSMLAPLDEGGIGFDAEWCDDFLHSVFAVLRPGEQLCHRSYIPKLDLEQTLDDGCVYEGTLREQRGRRTERSRVDRTGLVYSIQHHDFIGNHPLGKRLHQLTSPDTQRAAAAMLILSPAIPMLFMGEEFSCERPFQFFVDFTDDHLRHAVVEGRKREYPQHDWSSGTLPIDPKAFYDSKIGAADDGDPEMRQWYKSLIALRKSWRSIGLLDDANLSLHNDLDPGLFVLRYENESAIGVVAVRLAALPDDQVACGLQTPGQRVLDSRNGVTASDQILPNHAMVYFSAKSDAGSGTNGPVESPKKHC